MKQGAHRGALRTAGRKAGLFNLLVSPPTAGQKRKESYLLWRVFQTAYPTDASIDELSARVPIISCKGDWEGGISAGIWLRSEPDLRLTTILRLQPCKLPLRVHQACYRPHACSQRVQDGYSVSLFVAGLAFRIYGSFSLAKEEDDESISLAQQNAINAQQEAIDFYRGLTGSEPGYATLTDRFNTLSTSISSDPNEKGLSAATYAAIGNKWISLRQAIEKANQKPYTSSATASANTKVSGHTHAPVVTGHTHIPNKSRNVSIPVSAPEPDKSGHTHSEPVRERIVERETYIPVPIPVYEPTYRNRDEDEPRRYEAPSRSDDDDRGSTSDFPSASSSSNDDDDRGSTSDFPSSESSASSESGSESDF
jgi:hypothetical protein